MILVSLEEVDKHFTVPSGEVLTILRGVDLRVDTGEVVAIVGKSGSGKSTLLNILGLMDEPSNGTYELDGVDTTVLSDRRRSRIRSSQVGFIFQQFHLLDRRTALENVAEPMLYAGRGALVGRKDRAAALLHAVGLAERAYAMPHVLSGGEQQRVAIARALVREPRLILADEPTGSLDADTGEYVMHLMLELVRSKGVALILVTHDDDVAARADRVMHLVEGELHERVIS